MNVEAACHALLKDAEREIDAGHTKGALEFHLAAAKLLRQFNLKRHLLAVTEQGLKVRDRHRLTPVGVLAEVGRIPATRYYWEIRGCDAAVIQAIYAVGEALEQLPRPVLDKLVGVVF